MGRTKLRKNIFILMAHKQLFATVIGDTYQEKLNTLSLCNCCERHKINRPRIFTHWLELPFSNNYETNCSCNCRHVARWICRECTYEPEPEDVVR